VLDAAGREGIRCRDGFEEKKNGTINFSSKTLSG
jgi:hypothetical protein